MDARNSSLSAAAAASVTAFRSREVRDLRDEFDMVDLRESIDSDLRSMSWPLLVLVDLRRSGLLAMGLSCRLLLLTLLLLLALLLPLSLPSSTPLERLLDLRSVSYSCLTYGLSR